MTVKVRSLQKIYQTGQSAVGGISFGIGRNEVLGLLGPNGAGKSTTFSMLTMEIPKTNGEIEIMNT
jgi:ABC-type multidrug transport system ATPase subunit